jgi:hypothetical protein
VLGQIKQARDTAWYWADVMQAPRAHYSASAERTHSLRYRLWQLRLWQGRAQAAKWRAAHPPHLAAWLCIHRYEGSWTDPNAPYYGGLQFSSWFEQTYNAALYRSKGDANHWTPLEQMWTAERGWKDSGFRPWPTTARYCGLL